MKPPAQRPEIIANRVRSKRQLHRQVVFLLVEGDDDKKLYQRFVDGVRCRIQTAYGRPNVEAALAILEAEDDRVIGLVDSDMDGLEERALEGENLFRTDTHDAETMMLASPALDHVLREHGDERQVEGFEQGRPPVRESLLDLARMFGALRWISARKKLRLRFEAFPFARVINEKTWTLRREGVISELQGHSQSGILDDAALLDDVEVIFESGVDPWHLCCGHDMVAILAIGFRRVLGTRKESEVKPETLEKDLRLAYEAAYFATTQLCHSLREWQRDNTVILIDELHDDVGVGSA